MQESSSITNRNVSDAEIRAWLGELNAYQRATRERALARAHALPPERLLAIIQTGARTYRRRKRFSTFVELAVVLSWFPLSLLSLLVSNVSMVVVMGSFWLLLAVVLAWHYVSVPVRLHQSLITLLEKAEDPQLLGPAVSMYVRPDSYQGLQQTLGKTLCRLLPRLRADQTGLLTREQKRDLLLLIGSPQAEIEMRLKGLKALEQVGDESAYATIRALSQNASDGQVKHAAEQCLEYLLEHADERREMQTLLRASEAAAASAPTELLRTAAIPVETPSEQLLRPQA